MHQIIPQLCRIMGRPSLPTDYAAYDLETTGFDRKKDLIVEWGSVLVRDHQPVNRLSMYVNWFATPETVPPDWLVQQLASVKRAMEVTGRSYHVTPQLLKEQGLHPHKALQFMHDWLTEIQSQNLLMVTLNGWNFDNEMLVNHFQQDLDVDFKFRSDLVFDIGCIEKASQMFAEHDNEALPRSGEDLGTYFQRIASTRRRGIKYNLGHCVDKYQIKLAQEDLHGAGVDSYALCLLLEQFRQLAERPVPRPARAALPEVVDPKTQAKREENAATDKQRREAQAYFENPTFAESPEVPVNPPASPGYRKQRNR